MMDPRHVLILGGTSEARRLGEELSREPALAVTLSLAGRTTNPRLPTCRVRSGGFGGAEGLARTLRDSGVGILVDATHPFAARISVSAEAAAAATGVPLVVLERPPWRPAEGDRWIEAESIAAAAELLGEPRRTVFLTVGRQELAPFRAKSQHAYIVRSVDPADPAEAPAGARFILDRGPFDAVAEGRLLEALGVDVIVAKNSGGDATYGKIVAARTLGLPVVMVRRPRPPAEGSVGAVAEALARIRHLAGLPAARGE